MRWLFFLFLAINSAILIWGLTQPDPITARTRIIGPEVGDLQIISPEELDRLKSMPVDTGPYAQITDQQPSIHRDPLGTNTVEELVLPEGKSDQIQVATEATTTTLSTPESMSADEPTYASDKKVEQNEEEKDRDLESVPMAEVSSESDVDTGEVAEHLNPEQELPDNGKSEAREDNPPVEISISEAVDEEVAVCRVLGPIEDEVIARSILEALERQEIVSEFRTQPLRRVAGYWVVLPTYNDYDAAIEAIKQLKQQGIIDIQRFYRGDLKDAVSLGIYNRRFNAEKRKAQIEGKGFFPEILPRYTEIPAFWIDYRAQSSSDSDALDELRDRYPALEAKDVECPESLRL